jgi:hypothetical protein
VSDERKETCIHFRGVQHKRCEAGIALVTVRDASGGGPYRWPCLPPMVPGQTCATTCDSFRAPTAEEIAAEDAEREAAIAEWMDRRQCGNCPTCGEAMTERRVGRCVYAEPCGHRIGQVADAEDAP